MNSVRILLRLPMRTVWSTSWRFSPSWNTTAKPTWPVIPAGSEEEEELEVSILRSDEEDGEPILSAITDEAELEAVYDLMMNDLYAEEEET